MAAPTRTAQNVWTTENQKDYLQLISGEAGGAILSWIDYTGTPQGNLASGGGAVSSVFGRTGAVVAANNDYSFSQISGLVAIAQINATGTPSATTVLRGDGAWSGVGLAMLTATGSPSSSTFLRGDNVWSQVSFSNLSGQATGAQLPNPSSSTLGGVKSFASVSHQFVTQIGTDGTVTAAQPSASDVSGLAASATTDTTNANNISSGTLAVARGGTGTGSPSLVAGSGITVTGSWPNQTIAASAGNVNINGDTHPTSPPSQNDEFESGSLAGIWTQRNTPSLSFTNGSVVFTQTGNGGNVWQLITQTVPTAPYTCACACRPNLHVGNYYNAGIIIYDTGSGKLISFGPGFSTNAVVAVQRFTDFTTFASNQFTDNASSYPFGGFTPIYYAVNDDGTNFNFQVSPDNCSWRTVYSEARTAYLTPTSIGLGINIVINSTTGYVAYDWFRKIA